MTSSKISYGVKIVSTISLIVIKNYFKKTIIQ